MDLKAQLLDSVGDPVKMPNGEPANIKQVVMGALRFTVNGERLDQQERWELMKKLRDVDSYEFSEGDLALCKKWVIEAYPSPDVVGSVLDAIGVK